MSHEDGRGYVENAMTAKRTFWSLLASVAAITAALLIASGVGQPPRASSSVAPAVLSDAGSVTPGSSVLVPQDADQDGCDDRLEVGADPMSGGMRDPANFWDFFDATRDRAVSAADFFAVVSRFGAEWDSPLTKEEALAQALEPPPPPPAYHAGHDRSAPTPGADPWDTGPPDGAIGAQDFFAALVQFGHSCEWGWQPNIVVIMTDDQDDFGSLEVMPKVRSLLAEQGVTFTNSFVDFPLCCPSRTSFVTGQAAQNHGKLGINGGYGTFLPREGNTLPVWLQGVGYFTAHVGKYLNGYGSDVPATYIPPGWDQWFALPDPDTGRYFNYRLNENGTLTWHGSTPADYQTDVLAQKAVEFIQGRQGSPRPFFLWIAPLAPHAVMVAGHAIPAPRHDGSFADLPLPEPPNFNEADVSDKPTFMQALPLMEPEVVDSVTVSFRKHRETLLAVDDMVESVMTALETTGELDDTIIIFTSDNGYVHGQHRRPGGKTLVYEEEIRVPLIIRGPGIPENETRTQLVNNLDVVATIVEVAGATPGTTLDGRSLAEVLTEAATPWRTALLVQGVDLPVGFEIHARYFGVRTADFAFAKHYYYYSPLVEEELYDLTADPYELESQHNNPAYDAIASSLRDILATLETCAGASCWVDSAVP